MTANQLYKQFQNLQVEVTNLSGRVIAAKIAPMTANAETVRQAVDSGLNQTPNP